MAKSSPLLTNTVVEKHRRAAGEAKTNDPYSQRLTQGYETQGASPTLRALEAYKVLKDALLASGSHSPNVVQRAQEIVRDDQRKITGKVPSSISVRDIEKNVARLTQTAIQQNVTQARKGVIFPGDKDDQSSAKQSLTETPAPELGDLTISLESSNTDETTSIESDNASRQASEEAIDAESKTSLPENKPSLPPIAPQVREPTHTKFTVETRVKDQPSPFAMQDLPRPSQLKHQVEMIRAFSRLRAGEIPGGSTQTLDFISGASGGSIGPEAMLPGGSIAAGGTPAGGLPGSAVQGAKSLASQVPKVAGPALNALKALASKGALATLLGNPIALTVIGIVVVLFILVFISSGGGGNVANLIPTNEFLPLGTGSGEADPNVLYGDAVPIDVENPCWPVGGEITQLPNLNHGTRCGNKGVGVAYHQAIDIGASTGTRVYAPYAGRVCVKTQTPMGSDGKLEGYGVYMVICTDLGFDMVFAHLADYASGIKQGDQVTKGQLIAFSGNTGDSTGPHLHFEITNLSVCRPYNILDIVPSIPASNQVVESCSQYLGSELKYEPI